MLVVVVVLPSFCFSFLLLLLLSFILMLLMWCCSSHCFSTSSLTLPWTIAGFSQPFYTFSQAHHRVIHDTFIFNLFEIFFHSFTASATVLSGYFLPTGIFYLTLLHWHFTCVYQDLRGSQQFFLEVCRVSYWSSKHWSSPSVCLIHSNPQSSYSERFIFKFYQTLSWITCG